MAFNPQASSYVKILLSFSVRTERNSGPPPLLCSGVEKPETMLC